MTGRWEGLHLVAYAHARGDNGDARMRIKDGLEADGLLAGASAHLAADSAASVASGRPRDGMSRPGMSTQHRTCLDITVASCRNPWLGVSCAGLALHNREEGLSRTEAGPGDGGRTGRACRSGMERSRAGNARGAFFVLSQLTRGLGHESHERRQNAQSRRLREFKTAAHPAVLLVSLPRLLQTSPAPHCQPWK